MLEGDLSNMSSLMPIGRGWSLLRVLLMLIT